MINEVILCFMWEFVFFHFLFLYLSFFCSLPIIFLILVVIYTGLLRDKLFFDNSISGINFLLLWINIAFQFWECFKFYYALGKFLVI